MTTTAKGHEQNPDPETTTISPNTTEVLRGAEKAVGRGVSFMKNVRNRMDICFDCRAPSIVIEVPVYRSGYQDIRNRGGNIRCFTEITKDNLSYCKELLKLVNELRHLEGFQGGIAVSESEFMGTTVLEEAKPLTEVIYSNVREVVAQEQYIFDILWNKAIPAQDRIKEIEEGIAPQIIETISDPKSIISLIDKLVRSAQNQILVIFSTANAFHRQERAGNLNLLRETAIRGLDVRILTPIDDEIRAKAENEKTTMQLSRQGPRNFLDIRDIEPASLQTRISLLIVDGTYSLAVELKDDTKYSSPEAIGIAMYSNSAPTVQSYLSFFESLWILTNAYRQTLIHDKMQKDFINIAAHELRTPIQPIIGLADILQNEEINISADQRREFLSAIARNAHRLHKLAEDILDVARIDGKTLTLNKQKINLTKFLSDTIRDFVVSYKMPSSKATYKDIHWATSSQQQYLSDNDKGTTGLSTIPLITFDCKEKVDLYVLADSARLTQVIHNLLTNAIESTRKGGSSVSVILKSGDNEGGSKHAIVSVKDNGPGVDAAFLPKLFSKFATNSEKGTGLGLFISKSIIDVHDGQMWVENNQGGTGATFTFTLPLLAQQKHNKI